ncbi:major facilitator superfamily protein [Hirsutella rhossiliensis]|uniref:Major facilitator superfamily domain-containing protein n=1 Tax=Hirsutella rhossiliensis TaxID=111463 RepID=A0A9P8N3W1_9HYPO|nr:major facilitator superfamily domain-containing protein [Hirsutella rhossiliensis]KAH0965486.1 major facilitator superfamily domain-containing protein [Hirsutella rhossiliensis]
MVSPDGECPRTGSVEPADANPAADDSVSSAGTETLGGIEKSTKAGDVRPGAGKDSGASGVGDVDIEAQGVGHTQRSTPDLGVERVETRKSHHGFLSRLSQGKTEKLPPPVVPVMDLARGIVGWESQHDPEMPLNFSPSRKWLIVVLLAAITFMTPFASSILAPALSAMEAEFEEDDITKGSMPVSIFLLGYAVGPLFLAPLSEIYGRSVVLICASAWFCAWLIGCAVAPTLDALIFFRFMCGIGGSACQNIGGAIIADVFAVSDRGRAMTFWMLGPIFGPSCAPVIGAFVSQSIGWRWVNWLAFIPATMIVVGMMFLNRETNHQVLMARKAERLRGELGRPELRSCYVDPDAPMLTKRRILFIGLTRPPKMLFRSAILSSVSLYIAFVYGCLYLLFNTIPVVFRDSYHWSVGLTGLVYLALFVGYAVGLLSFSLLSDRTVVHMTATNGGVYEPEMRLPDCMWFALILPITFFWYGWSADKALHWIVPVIGIVPFGHAASGLAAFSVLRCAVAAFLPLAGPQMYKTMGVGWGSSLLGFVAVALVPIPALIYKYGKWMRTRYPLKL